MRLLRLLVDFDPDRRWVRLQMEGTGNEASGFGLDDAFDTSDVVAAACATGRVVQRNDEHWICDSADCEALGDLVSEMLFYFLRSGEPRSELVALRERFKPIWDEGAPTRPPLSLWATACLDLEVRERIAEEARTSNELWEQSELHVVVEPHLRACINELAGRYEQIALAAQDVAGFGKMAPSGRHRGRERVVGREVG